MCICIGSMNICRSFRRGVIDKRSHGRFEPFGAGLGDRRVRVRVIGKDFASSGRVSPYPPEPIWTGHGDRGWGTTLFYIIRYFVLCATLPTGKVLFVILFGAVCYTFVSARISDVSANPDTSFSYQKTYVVSAMYQRCIRKIILIRL